MSGGVVAEVIALIAIFLSGVTCGVIVTVSRSIRREDRRLSLNGRPPGPAARGSRLLTGVGSRTVRMGPVNPSGRVTRRGG